MFPEKIFFPINQYSCLTPKSLDPKIPLVFSSRLDLSGQEGYLSGLMKKSTDPWI
jgi:hypothetical protein